MIDPMKDEGRRRADPSIMTANLSVANLSDTMDLPVSAKAFEVTNTGASNVKIKYTPLGRSDGAEPEAVTVSVLAGTVRPIAAGARRFWATPTDLALGLNGGTLEVLLHLE